MLVSTLNITPLFHQSVFQNCSDAIAFYVFLFREREEHFPSLFKINALLIIIIIN